MLQIDPEQINKLNAIAAELNQSANALFPQCSCKKCQAACTDSPGWFAPGEVQQVASFLGLSEKELYEKYLRISYWNSDHAIAQDVFVPSPAVVGNAGAMIPRIPNGACVFFKEGRCEIHAVKPCECKQYMHTDTESNVFYERRKHIALQWIEHQDYIKNLCGEEPYISALWGDETNDQD